MFCTFLKNQKQNNLYSESVQILEVASFFLGPVLVPLTPASTSSDGECSSCDVSTYKASGKGTGAGLFKNAGNFDEPINSESWF